MGMSARRSEIKKRLAALKAKKTVKMQHPSGESQYGRKRRYLRANGGWGFEYAEPKPWGGD